MSNKTRDGKQKIDVYIDFVGLRIDGESGGRRALAVDPNIADALNTVKGYVEEKTRRNNYMVYHNGRFISRPEVKGSNKTVEDGDVFKIIPVMSGG